MISCVSSSLFVILLSSRRMYKFINFFSLRNIQLLIEMQMLIYDRFKNLLNKISLNPIYVIKLPNPFIILKT